MTVTLTGAERQALHEGVCSQHRDTVPGVYVCAPCERAGDEAVEGIVAARLVELVDRVADEAWKYAVTRSSLAGPPVESLTLAQIPDIVRRALGLSTSGED